jgi:Patatin-like phospholipase
MPKRLAITISGAVSLGSFEAGVLYEIISAIGQHNTAIDEANKNSAVKDDTNKIYIDVLTGASAGGMTATIAAQKLLYEKNALNGAYSNAFYLPWVADVTLDGLLALNNGEDPAKSIFSSDFVADISRRYLTARYQSHADVPQSPHPAINTDLKSDDKNLKLYLGLAMSNLNGVDYGLPMQPSGQFVYTRHQDALTTWFDTRTLATDDTFDFWDPLRNAAVSCGAFAFAFRPVDVNRHDFEYKLPNLLSKILPVQAFTYTDGGTFQNEPLGMAKLLVDKIDEHQDVENRFFLFVSPDSKDSTATSHDNFNVATADFKNTAVQLAEAIFAQARFQDWVTADTINKQVDLLDQRASALRVKLLADPTLTATLQAAADALLPSLIPDEGKLNAARARLQQQYGKEYAVMNDPAKKSWIDSILTLETSANLASSDKMTIYGITATKQELASSELCSFAGFFDRSYRDHDYDVGRTKARECLANTLFGLPAPIQYQTETIRPLTPNLGGIQLDKMDPNIRTNVREQLRDRGMQLMKEAGLNWVTRDGIDLFFIKPQLNKLLKL